MSIGNCPLCGRENDDENEICMYCVLRQISLSIEDVPEWDEAESIEQDLARWPSNYEFDDRTDAEKL